MIANGELENDTFDFQCIIRNGMDWGEIEGCQGSNEGQGHLHDYRVIAGALDHEIKWTPWITINGVGKRHLHETILKI